jgi:hypothetical protein
LETAASKPVETAKSVSGDWLPTPEIARNRANSRVSQDSKWETGLGGWGTRIRTWMNGVPTYLGQKPSSTTVTLKFRC